MEKYCGSKILLEDEKLETVLQRSKDYMCLIDRLVVKDFDEDDMHRMADSVDTAFYEGEGDVYVEVNGEETDCIFQ